MKPKAKHAFVGLAGNMFPESMAADLFKKTPRSEFQLHPTLTLTVSPVARVEGDYPRVVYDGQTRYNLHNPVEASNHTKSFTPVTSEEGFLLAQINNVISYLAYLTREPITITDDAEREMITASGIIVDHVTGLLMQRFTDRVQEFPALRILSNRNNGVLNLVAAHDLFKHRVTFFPEIVSSEEDAQSKTYRLIVHVDIVVFVVGTEYEKNVTHKRRCLTVADDVASISAFAKSKNVDIRCGYHLPSVADHHETSALAVCVRSELSRTDDSVYDGLSHRELVKIAVSRELASDSVASGMSGDDIRELLRKDDAAEDLDDIFDPADEDEDLDLEDEDESVEEDDDEPAPSRKIRPMRPTDFRPKG